MRHRKYTLKLGRTSAHLDALLASLVCNLIAARRIQTTIRKAKAARRVAEKMVTLGKDGSLSARRRAIARLRRPDLVKVLFEEIAPAFKDRAGGYTRIMRLGRRSSDSSEMALLEWVNYIPKPPKKKDKKEKGETKPPADAAKGEAKKVKGKAKEEAAPKKKTKKEEKAPA